MAEGRVLCTELPKHVDEEVRVAGWVEEIRNFGGIKFLIVRDREGSFQITLPKAKVDAKLFSLVDEITKESVIEAKGIVRKSDKARLGIELIPQEIKIHSLADTPTPIDMSGKIHSDLSVRLDYRFLDLRDHKRQAIFRIRSKIFKFVCEYFDSRGFININTPKLTTLGVESGAELFRVDYFGREAFLAQSPQVYKQMFVAAGFEKVYEIAPVFRAEKSHTTRHLAEFTGIDFEQGFIESEEDVMTTVEGLMQHIIKRLKEECARELEMFNRELPELKKIPRVELSEAKKWLAERGHELPENEDLDAKGESLLSEIIKERFDNEFVFVTLYPWEKRPFYHMRPENNPSLTKSFDLIWNGVEISTGAQREHRYEILKRQAQEKGLDLDKMRGYVDIFKYGCPPHGGAGLGLDRIVECLLKLDNIREAILLPRDPERIYP